MALSTSPRWRSRLAAAVEHTTFQRAIVALICINAITLGLETSPAAMAAAGPALQLIDRCILAVFVAELALRIAAHGLRFFRDPWGVFDFAVVGIALLPATGAFSVLRTLRVLRVLRLVSTVPRMRRVIEALLSSLPGLGSVAAILALVFYVGGVMATKLFGADFPQWFGTLPRSLFSLFQIMTLESWSMGIVRPVMALHPYAWAFFVTFILAATFTMLNLFIAVVVNAMQSRYHEQEEEVARAAHEERVETLEAVRRLREEVRTLNEQLRAARGPR